MSTSIKGRALAIVVGCAFAAGGLTIILGKDLLHPLDWVSMQWITILTVFGTIGAGHLLHDAWRARHLFACFGFLALFGAGTSLVVCQSLGRQAEVSETSTMSAEAVNQAISDKMADLKSAKARRDYADKAGDREMTGQRCGPRCREWRQNSKDISVVIAQLEKDIAALGPKRPTNAKAERFADIVALFGIDKLKTMAMFSLLEPLLWTLFFEIGSIVSLGFAFRTSRKIEASQPEIPERSVPVPANDKAVSENSTDIPGNPPAPPKGPRRRGRKADKTVVDFSEKFKERNGRAPSGGEIKAAFPELPTSTAYDYSQRARASA